MTKAQLRTIVRNLIRDSQGLAWQDTTLDVLISAFYDELWGQLLDVAPHFNSELETIDGLYPPGYLELNELQRRIYKIQFITREDHIYTSTSLRDVVISEETEITAPIYTYAVMQQQLWLYPLDETTALELRYSYLPTAFTLLSENAELSWPDGHDSALFLSIAGRIATGDEANRYMVLGEAALARAKQAAARQHLDPAVMYLTGSPLEWGDSNA